jgi:hypothetical protein
LFTLLFFCLLNREPALRAVWLNIVHAGSRGTRHIHPSRDELLDELASHSGFSQMSQQPFHKRTEPRAQLDILREMYTELAPHEAAFLTQIILQDLRPVLYPLPIVNTTLNLLYALAERTRNANWGFIRQ